MSEYRASSCSLNFMCLWYLMTAAAAAGQEWEILPNFRKLRFEDLVDHPLGKAGRVRAFAGNAVRLKAMRRVVQRSLEGPLVAVTQHPDKDGSGYRSGTGGYRLVAVCDLHIFTFQRDRDGKPEVLRSLPVELFGLLPQQVDQVEGIVALSLAALADDACKLRSPGLQWLSVLTVHVSSGLRQRSTSPVY